MGKVQREKKKKYKKKVRKGFRKATFIIGLTAISLLVLAAFILIGERFGIIQFYVGGSLLGLSPMDTWLVIILCVFAPVFIILFVLLYKMKLLKIKS